MEIEKFVKDLNKRFLNPHGEVKMKGRSQDLGILKNIKRCGEKCVLFIFQKEILSCDFSISSLTWSCEGRDVKIKWEDFWIANKNFSTIYREVEKNYSKNRVLEVIERGFPPSRSR